MPQALGLLTLIPNIGTLLGAGGLFGFLSGGLGSTLLTVGLSFGLNYLGSLLLKPKTPKPEDVQNIIRSSISPRVRHKGRGKVGGTAAFRDSKDGTFYEVIATGHGELAEIEEIWVDDTAVDIDGTGLVTAPENLAGKLRIQYRMGLPTETSYADLTAAIPEWTADHRGDGVSSIFVQQLPVDADEFTQVFPNGVYTGYRAVIKGAKLYDPTDPAMDIDNPGTWAWSDNLARICHDYLTHPDGLRLPKSLLRTPLARLAWEQAVRDCNDPIPLKLGGTEPRYRLWGSYTLDERPADILKRFFDAGDARIFATSDGGLGLDVGKWTEPTVVIDESMIIGFEGFGRGRDILQTANLIRSTYVSEPHDFQSTEAEPWADEEDILIRGEMPIPVDFICAPSHSQCRRLMKIAADDANPEWVGSFTCNLKALGAVGERRVRIIYPAFGVDAVFKVKDSRFVLGDGATLVGVQIDVSSTSADTYSWDAAAEEGTAPAADDTTIDHEVPLPSDFAVVMTHQTTGGVQVPRARITWSAVAASLRVEVEFKDSDVSVWERLSPVSGETSVLSPPLNDSASYDFRARCKTITGRAGEWATVITKGTAVDAVAPGPVTGVSKTGGAGQVVLAWTNPASANFDAVKIRRNTSNTEGGAVLVKTKYGSASAADTWTNTGLAPGTYFYWIKAMNASGVESTSVATGSVTVT